MKKSTLLLYSIHYVIIKKMFSILKKFRKKELWLFPGKIVFVLHHQFNQVLMVIFKKKINQELNLVLISVKKKKLK